LQIITKIISKVKQTWHFTLGKHHRSLLRKNRKNQLNTPKDDAFHLRSAMYWLLKAQQKSGSNGVALSYNLYRGWLSAYPETTGYIIDTFIRYSKMIDNPFFVEKAVEMGEWEMSVQMLDGSIPKVFAANKETDVFDTGMVIHGWVSLFIETADQKYLDAACKAGEWLLKVQSTNGSWSSFTFGDIPHAYHSKVAWSLFRLWKVSQDQRYYHAAVNNINWVLKQRQTNGWINFFEFSDGQTAYTHTIAYTLQGFVGICQLSDKKSFLYKSLIDTCIRISNIIQLKVNPESDTLPLAGEFDSFWKPDNSYTCLTGNCQIAIVFYQLYEITRDVQFAETADRLIDFVIKTQETGDNKIAFFNGIAGSYPIGGKYHPYEFPNWAAKFFADALMLKIRLR